MLACAICYDANRIQGMPQNSIQVKSLQREHSLKYLGITFDRPLSFNVHFSNTVDKAVKGITAVKTMAENTPHPV